MAISMYKWPGSPNEKKKCMNKGSLGCFKPERVSLLKRPETVLFKGEEVLPSGECRSCGAKRYVVKLSLMGASVDDNLRTFFPRHGRQRDARGRRNVMQVVAKMQ
jgi:hypothetical protein